MIIKTSTKVTKNNKRVETNRQYYECNNYELTKLDNGGVELKLDNENNDIILIEPGNWDTKEVKSVHIYQIDPAETKGYYVVPEEAHQTLDKLYESVEL